ncbi:MAG: hypothetical protein QXI28_05145 [Candidatus Hadarchaeales archaeon]
MALGLTEILLTAVGISIIGALLRYGGVVAKGGLGVRLLIVSVSFLLLGVGFELLSNVFEVYGNISVAEQLRRAGVYLGQTVGGICGIVGGVLIALKALLSPE